MTTTIEPTVLDPQRRGDPFVYKGVLDGGWQNAMFPGGFKFTLRAFLPPTSQTTDTDTFPAGGVIDQATSAAGEITFSDAVTFFVTFLSMRTTNWPARKLFWDMVGTVDSGHSYTLDSGTIQILPDVTRSV